MIVLAVTKMAYLQEDNAQLYLINDALIEKNLHNESYIGQLEGDLRDIKDINKGLNEGLNEELKRKKKWRQATLYSVGFNAIFLASLFVLSR